MTRSGLPAVARAAGRVPTPVLAFANRSVFAVGEAPFGRAAAVLELVVRDRNCVLGHVGDAGRLDAGHQALLATATRAATALPAYSLVGEHAHLALLASGSRPDVPRP